MGPLSACFLTLCLLDPGAAGKHPSQTSSSPWWADSLLLTLDQEPAAPQPRTEASQRAYLIYVMALVTDWPEGTFQNADQPFVIGLLGPDDLALDLASLRSKTVKGRRILIKRSQNLDALHGAHILYISPSSGQDLPYLIRALGDRSVLTLGEQENFTRLGGIVRCSPGEGLVPSEVNLRVAKEAHLTFRSQFLKMVKRVAY